jgi:hypothetical protein
MASIKRKNKDYSFNPASFLSGTHKFNPVGAISSWWNEEDEVDPKKKYIQTGGDMTVGEGIYDQRFATPDFLDEKMMQPLSGPSPSLPDRSADEPPPEFVSSQMTQQKSYSDPEFTGGELEERRIAAEKALAQQTPSLAPPEAGMLASLLGQNKDSGLTHVGGAMAEVGEDPNKKAYLHHTLQNRFPSLDLAGISERVKAEEEGRGLAKSYGNGSKKTKPWESLTVLEGGSAAKQIAGSPHDGTAAPQSLLTATQGMEDYDDDLGNAIDQEEGEGLMAKLGGLMSSDSSKTKPLSKGKQAAVKLATSLLTAKDDPIQSAPVAGVKMGRVAFPNLLASSQRPVNPRYTNKGLG